MKRTIVVAMALALLLTGSPSPFAATEGTDLRIGNYVLVDKTRVGLFDLHLSYRASLTNRGTTGLGGATAEIRSILDILIVDGRLTFGPVAAGQTVPSLDTFTLRLPFGQALDIRLLDRLLRWNITIGNAAPIADAGPDQTVPLAGTARLDGRGSTDADGDLLTYRWAFAAKPSGSAAALSGAGTATPSFILDLPGQYDVALIVNDGHADSAPDTVRISTANSRPVADAGADQTAYVGGLVTLDGTASSDIDGDPISYAWSFTSRPAGSQAALSNAAAARPYFTVDRPGDYDLQLVVNDRIVDSAPDSVRISTLNSAPVADAGADREATVGETVTFDGSGSHDADGDPLTFAWSLLAQPAGSAAVLGDAGQESVTLVPDRAGDYVVQLIVDDGHATSPADTAIVSVTGPPPPLNRDPRITSDPVTTGQAGTPYLYQVAADDPDGDPLAYGLSLFPDGMTISAGGLIEWTPDTADRFDVTVEVTDGRGGHASQSFSIDVGAAPGVPPPTVTLDPTVPREVTQIEGFAGEPARPVVALTDRSNIPMHFVENELIVVSNDVASVAEIAARWGGTLVRSIVPADHGLPGAAQHLIRIDPATVDPSELVADLQRLEPAASNALRVSSDTGLRLLAAAAHESASGGTVALNVVMLPAGFQERTTTENVSLGSCASPPPVGVPPGNDGCVSPLIAGTESFNSNAFAWSYMTTGSPQNIGVGEAWRSLSLAGLLGNTVTIAVIDGGFSATAVDNPVDTEHHGNGLFDDVGYTPNPITCTNGFPCPWHGANVVAAAMGPADDGKGAAGPGGPVARAVTIRYAGDAYSLMSGFLIALDSAPRVINMSFGGRLPATLAWVNQPFSLLTAGVSPAVVLIAAAGNDGANIDSEDCVPIVESPCWEDAFYSPCEADGVTCIGALADNSTTRRAGSNYGAEDVDLFAPGNLWVGGDPFDPEPHLFGATSAAAPFVSGVAALVIAADPTLVGNEVASILIQTAITSTDPTVRRYVNAQGAVNQALGGSTVCVPPTLLTLTPDFPTVPCVERVLEVTHTQVFGPFRYQWRKLIPGTNEWVDLPDGDNVTGATTARMTINPFRPADEGRYDVVVSNLCGSTTSGGVAASVVDGHQELAPSMPMARNNHAMAYDTARSRMVLYGGYTVVQYNGRTLFKPSNETWERTGDGTWQVITDLGPGRRIRAAMAYDEARGVSVLFGGWICTLSDFCPWGVPEGEPNYLFDTWEWNGATWTRIPTGTAAYPVWHSMTYDSVRRRVVMYGGQDQVGNIGTTLLEWDGTTWTGRATLPDPVFGYPPPVIPSPITFDRARNVYVLYRVFDTWELDGTGRWARKAGQVAAMGTTSLPGGISFDTDRGKTLLYNVVNTSPTTSSGALWEWTGSTWIRKLAPLPGADSLVMAYDRGRRRTVFTGFGGGFLDSSAVWEWRYFLDDPTCSLGSQ